MNPNELIIRFDSVDRQTEGPVTRLVGFVRARNLLPLLDAADLEANPRTAKIGPITADIIESIEKTPELFPFKTKGILVASANCRELERRRYHMTFENPDIEGILDGGHNTLAIGTHILAVAHGDPKSVKRIKAWPDFRAAWEASRKEVTALKASTASGSGGPLDFLIPVEVLIPTDTEDTLALEAFTSSLFEIGAARNNNRQLADEAKANKKGFYDELRKHVPASIAKRVEWKSNDGGEIKVRDLVAFSWVPLSAAELPPGVSPPRPADIYSGKGKCSSAFDTLMENADVSTKMADGTHELHSTVIGGALAIAGELPELIDTIYAEFPLAYNRTGGSFGMLRAVTPAKDLRTKPTTPFGKVSMGYRYPDGFIVPLVYGLKALLETDAAGKVQWKTDPGTFLTEHLDEIVRKYKVLIQAFGGDAQKIGKNEGSYSLAYDAFETELLKRRQAA
ncbi:hypothetical protein ACFB49_46870 [Sphingomonas sp. DBB INV C78]|uniref:hypothetical protein n=1 Tax=Sphingomonas sp. DBB INV C78 TaxID=3349434 RepID=UPI0036D2C503